MKINIFSLVFLIGQTIFLMASDIENAESFTGFYGQAKFIGSSLCWKTRSSIVDFNTINRF